MQQVYASDQSLMPMKAHARRKVASMFHDHLDGHIRPSLLSLAFFTNYKGLRRSCLLLFYILISRIVIAMSAIVHAIVQVN